MATPIVRCLVLVLAPSDASACGMWTLEELASGDTARFDVSSVLHGTRGKKKIGSVAGTSITIGKSTYPVDVAPLPHDGKRPIPVRWRVSVKRGDEIFAEGDAMALCRPGSGDENAKLTPEQEAFERADVVRHVFHYLAWRGR